MFEDASRKRCPTCNYNLEGLAETRCPECARDFDPDNPTTDCADGPKTWTSASLGLALIASIHLLTLAVSTFDVGFRVPGEWYPLGGVRDGFHRQVCHVHIAPDFDCVHADAKAKSDLHRRGRSCIGYHLDRERGSPHELPLTDDRVPLRTSSRTLRIDRSRNIAVRYASSNGDSILLQR